MDDADLDGDGEADYRIPPFWEYGNTRGYRPFTDLTGDLAKLTRYVAVDGLFTASPLYSPALTPPALPATLQLDVTMYQGLPGFDARRVLKPDLLTARVQALEPTLRVSTKVQETPLVGRAAQVFACFATAFGPPAEWHSCFGDQLGGNPWADLYLYHRDRLPRFVDGDADYELPIFVYSTPDLSHPPTVGGFVDDDWETGTQSFVFAFTTPYTRDVYGWGLTWVLTHESGHHLGLSHPWSGYDSETGTFLSQRGRFAYLYVGNDLNTGVGESFLNFDFGQFDRDNVDRWLTAAYLNQTNAVLARIYASPRAAEARPALLAADGRAAQALTTYAAYDWRGAADHAGAAYRLVRGVAATLHISLAPDVRPRPKQPGRPLREHQRPPRRPLPDAERRPAPARAVLSHLR